MNTTLEVTAYQGASIYNKPLYYVTTVFFLTVFAFAVFYPESGTIIKEINVPVLLPILCLLTMIGLIPMYFYSGLPRSIPVLILPILLLMLVSAWRLLPDPEAWNRTMALMGTGVTGFFAGLLLFGSPRALHFFMSILFGCLALFMAFCLVETVQTGSANYPILEIHKHAQLSHTFFLALGPLYFALTRKGMLRIVSIALILSCFLSFYFLNSRFGILLPLVLVPLQLMLTRLSLRRIALLGMAGILAAILAFHVTSEFKLLFNHQVESISYRAEGPFFGYHVLTSSTGNLLLGNGLRSDKSDHLDDYSPRFPDLTYRKFASLVRRIKSLDNDYLSLLVDLGLPFFLLYFGAMAVPVLRAIGQCRRQTPPADVLAMTFIIATMLIHFLIYDGLYYASVCLLFHTLLGLLTARTLRAAGKDTAPPAPAAGQPSRSPDRL